MTKRITVYVREDDDEILSWYEGAPRSYRAAMVRLALLNAARQGEDTTRFFRAKPSQDQEEHRATQQTQEASEIERVKKISVVVDDHKRQLDHLAEAIEKARTLIKVIDIILKR